MSDQIVTLVGCWVCGADPVKFDPKGAPLCENCDPEDTTTLMVLLGSLALPTVAHPQVVFLLFVAGMSVFLFKVLFPGDPRQHL